MHLTKHLLLAALATLPWIGIAAANAPVPAVQTTAEAITGTLGNGITLRFALHDGFLLGLQSAEAGGTPLKSDATVVRPVLAEEFAPDRRIWEFLKLKEAKVVGDALEIHTELLASTSDEAFRAFFLYTGDRDRAAQEPLTPDLKALQQKNEAAIGRVEPFLTEHKEWKKWSDDLANAESKISGGQDPHGKSAQTVRNLKLRMQQNHARILTEVAASKPDLAAAGEAMAAFEAALSKRALEIGKIHRDYYELANLRLPAESCAIPYLKDQVAQRGTAAKPGGSLVWRIRPATRTIAGWVYQGWTSQYEFRLSDHRKVNVLRQIGTWEIGGKVADLTLVNFRFRGIGGIEHTVKGKDGQSSTTFTTTETFPGAAGKGPVISPAAPDPSGKDFADRGYALQHRVGAWIGRLARGAGVGFVDFQYRPETIFLSTFERMDNLRALTEIFPGDAQVSQTDEWWFAQTDTAKTEPQLYLALTAKPGFTRDEARNRWQETDQHFRDAVSKELNFVQREVEPGVGMNIDNAFGPNVAGLAARFEEFAALGVKSVYVHHPGWQNGRDREPGQTVGGGDCSINDWLPLTSAQEPWKNVTRNAARTGITYNIWVTGMNWREAPFHKEVGADLKNWAINRPGMKDSSGYPPWHDNLNPLAPSCLDAFLGRMKKVREEYGYQGIWYDSFQNLFMTTLDWANGTGAPLIRPWWEIIAAWSREGVDMTSESHAFPGKSCSIECDPTPDTSSWFYNQTFRWFRTDFPDPGTPRADTLAFRFMANKAWAAPQVAASRKPEATIPSFGRLAREYSAALPSLRRGFVLPEESGMLWLSFKDNSEGIWFPFTPQAIPSGVTAAYVLDNTAVTGKIDPEKTYRVKAADLLAAFKIRTAPEKDERIGKTYDPPKPVWPAWAKP